MLLVFVGKTNWFWLLVLVYSNMIGLESRTNLPSNPFRPSGTDKHCALLSMMNFMKLANLMGNPVQIMCTTSRHFYFHEISYLSLLPFSFTTFRLMKKSLLYHSLILRLSLFSFVLFMIQYKKNIDSFKQNRRMRTKIYSSKIIGIVLPKICW